MFIHNFNPVLLSIGPVEIRWYGLVYVLGFVAMYYGLRKIADYSSEEADSLLIWLVVGLLIGARSFFFLFYRPDIFSITEFFSVWHGGMSFHGALTGLGVAAYLWAKRNGKDIWQIFDVGAITSPWFLAFGRIANFLNAEIVGTVFDGAWCFIFPGVDSCRHPVQLYAVLKNIILGSIIFALWRMQKFTSGFLFWMFALIYAILRFTVNFWRDDPVILFTWLKMGQILSIALALVAVYVLVRHYKKDLKKLVAK